MTKAADARDAAVHFECVKVSSRQTKEGFFVTLCIHPSDVPVDVVMALAGTRYIAALVELTEHGEPRKGRETEEGERAVQSAAMLCRNLTFQRWLVKAGFAFEASEDQAREALIDYCAIQSRATLKDDRRARARFNELKQRFEQDAL